MVTLYPVYEGSTFPFPNQRNLPLRGW